MCLTTFFDCNVSTDATLPSVTVSPIATTKAFVCPACGVNKFTGKLSCCSRGGTWFNNCGDDGDEFDHTWREGLVSCQSKLWQRSYAICMSCFPLLAHVQMFTAAQTSNAPATIPACPKCASVVQNWTTNPVAVVLAVLGSAFAAIPTTQAFCTRGEKEFCRVTAPLMRKPRLQQRLSTDCRPFPCVPNAAWNRANPVVVVSVVPGSAAVAISTTQTFCSRGKKAFSPAKALWACLHNSHKKPKCKSFIRRILNHKALRSTRILESSSSLRTWSSSPVFSSFYYDQLLTVI